MLVYAYISTATRPHLAKYLFNRKMFGTSVAENCKMRARFDHNTLSRTFTGFETTQQKQASAPESLLNAYIFEYEKYCLLRFNAV